jgi:hypothetical protein
MTLCNSSVSVTSGARGRAVGGLRYLRRILSLADVKTGLVEKDSLVEVS